VSLKGKKIKMFGIFCGAIEAEHIIHRERKKLRKI
jgi:hypothetical protein